MVYSFARDIVVPCFSIESHTKIGLSSKMKLLTQKELQEAKLWTEKFLPKSIFAHLWLTMNLDQPGGIGTSQNALCYVDQWPNPNVIAGTDCGKAYHVEDYPVICMFSNAPSENSSIVEEFLRELANEIGVKRAGGVEAQMISEEWHRVFDEVFANRLGLNASIAKDHVKTYWMTPDQRNRLQNQSIQPPAGFEFDSLDSIDAEYVDKTWPHHFDGSLKMIERRIRDCPSVCLREVITKRLASFELMLDMGTMNHLYTIAEFRRKGLAQLVELKLAQLLIKRGYIPTKGVYVGNVNAEKMTEAYSGWSFVCNAAFVRYGDENMKKAYQESDNGRDNHIS